MLLLLKGCYSISFAHRTEEALRVSSTKELSEPTLCAMVALNKIRGNGGGGSGQFEIDEEEDDRKNKKMTTEQREITTGNNNKQLSHHPRRKQDP